MQNFEFLRAYHPLMSIHCFRIQRNRAQKQTELLRQTFLVLILLDISSHWCQMYSTASLKRHHKSDGGNEGRFFLVRWYYHYYYFFGYCCVGAEFTYVALYGLAHVTVDDVFLKALGDGLLLLCAPACAVKQVVNVFQLTSACHAVASYDAKQRKDR